MSNMVFLLFGIFIIEKCISLDFQAIQELKLLEMSQKIIHLIFLKKINRNVYQVWSHGFKRIHRQFDVLDRISIEIKLCEVLEQVHVVRQLLQVVIAEIELD